MMTFVNSPFAAASMSADKIFNNVLLYKEVNNKISGFLKNHTAVTEKYKVRIFMYTNLYGRRI
jgi:hypothetical protein